MASLSKNFVAGMLIFGFFIIVTLCLQFIAHKDVDSFANYSIVAHRNKKAFTRAMNCRCLPGSIPRWSGPGSEYYCHNLSDSSYDVCY